MSVFSLQVVASDRVFYDGKCKICILPVSDGELAIMAHHEEMVVAVAIGEMRFQLEDDSWITAVVAKGFAEVADNRLKVLVYSAEKPEEIDLKRAEEDKERAEEQLRQKQSIQEHHISEASLARAIKRIQEAGKVHPTGY